MADERKIRVKVTIDYPSGEGKRTRITDAETGAIVTGVRAVDIHQEYGEDPTLVLEIKNFAAQIVGEADIAPEATGAQRWPTQLGSVGIAQDTAEAVSDHDANPAPGEDALRGPFGPLGPGRVP